MHKLSELKKYFEYFKPAEITFIKYGEDCPVIIKKIDNFNQFRNLILKYNNEDSKYCAYCCINSHVSNRLINNVNVVDKIFFDIDCYDNKEEAEEIKQELDSNKIKWEYHVKSGMGRYLFIPIKPIIIDDENRNSVCNFVASVTDYFNEKFKSLDSRCKDISRLSRVWGSLNYKYVLKDKNKGEALLCESLQKQDITKLDKLNNLEIIKKLASERKHCYPIFSDQTIDECYACEELIKNPLNDEIENTGFNDKLGKNLTIYCCRKYGKGGLNKARKIYRFRKKNSQEADGWFKKAENDKDFKLNCFEIQNYLNQFYPDIKIDTCKKCMMERKNRIVYTNEKDGIKDLKEKYRKKFKFFIKNDEKFKGIVTPSEQGDAKRMFNVGWVTRNKKREKKIDYSLELTYEDINKPYDELHDFIFLGEKNPDSRVVEVKKIETAFFYRYIFKEGDAEYVLLSERKLDYEETIVYGMTLDIDDKTLIGDRTAFLSSKIPIIFLHHHKTKQVKFSSIVEVFNKVDMHKQEFLDNLFSHYNSREQLATYHQPKFINNLVLSFLLSGKLKYPLHINIIGPPNCGKSELISCLSDKFKEEVVACGNSTFKGLIPSFYGTIPNLGKLLSTRRLCLLDELLDMIQRSGDASKGDVASMFTTSNNILEHKKVTYSSGKSSISNSVMRSRVLSANNPLRGRTEQETIESMPPQFMDRFLLVRFTNNYKKYVSRRKGEVLLVERSLTDEEIVGVVDFFQSFLTEFDEGRVLDIIDRIKPYSQPYMIPFLEGRMTSHHIFLLFDGLIKSRCLFEHSNNFEAVDEDYKNLENFLKDYNKWWWDDKIPEGSKVQNFLTKELNILIILVGDGIYRNRLKELLFERNIEVDYNLKFLYDNKILKTDGNNYITRINRECEELELDDVKL